MVNVGIGNFAAQKDEAGWNPCRMEATFPGRPPPQSEVVAASRVVIVFQDPPPFCRRCRDPEDVKEILCIKRAEHLMRCSSSSSYIDCKSDLQSEISSKS